MQGLWSYQTNHLWVLLPLQALMMVVMVVVVMMLEVMLLMVMCLIGCYVIVVRQWWQWQLHLSTGEWYESLDWS